MRYMLDTNMISHILKQQPNVMAKLLSVPMQSLCISAITYSEISYGLAKKPEAYKLHRAVKELLLCVEVLDFDKQVAKIYGEFKAKVEQQGKMLTPLDMQIAAHSYAVGAVLVSNDQAFAQIKELTVQDWTK
ncbi:type II toxin-antitoxin system VapC family toxin [Glaesserella sp.]|uniref:type II toxin-antitoxin system VapC family toxin n=1 Tax=Glaesserella sp. TaxID=2094731 RepID=UPI00359F9A8B